MEGELKYYKGLVGGFTKVYGLIERSDFVAFKSQKNREEMVRVVLESGWNSAEVYPHNKDITQFWLEIKGQKNKKIKYFFKTNTPEEQ